jgi:ribosomal protein S12 methylthiotransferase accessory factor
MKLNLAPEPDARMHLGRWTILADPSVGLITQLVSEADGFSDEPNWPLVRADLAPTAGIDPSGYDFSPACGARADESWDLPWVSAVFEAVERYCMSLPNRDRLSKGGYLGESTQLDPARLMDVGASAAEVRVERSRHRWWIDAFTLDGEKVQVPAQSVFVPFREQDWKEPLLRDSVSTGAAAGLRRDWAIVRGLLEAAERDAVMLLHFGIAASEPIPAEMLSGRARRMLDDLASRGLSATILRVHTGLPLSAVVVRVEDSRGPWPRAAVGSCARLTTNDAVVGALLEAAVYKRNLRFRTNKHFRQAVVERADIQCLEDRASYWYGNDRLMELPYFAEPNAEGRWAPVSAAGDAHVLMDAAKEALNPLIVDVTTADVARLGGYVMKVIAPDLQPMYLSERVTTRTARMGPIDLNQYEPHPFL